MFVWTEFDGIVLPIALLVVIFLSVGTFLLTRNKSECIKRIPLIVISSIMLGLEVVKQIINIVDGYSFWSIPLHFCSLFLYFFPLASFFTGKIAKFGRAMSFIIATLFALLFYINPDSIIGSSCENIFASFSSFHTFTYHHLILLFYLIMLLEKLYIPSKSDFLYAFLGITGYAVIAIPMAHMLDTNFCNILSNNIAFIEEIRLQVGQVAYTTLFYLTGVVGAELIVGLSNGIKMLVDKKKNEKDSFNIIMKTLKRG